MRIVFGDFALDTDRRELRRGAQPVHLAPKAFQLLQILAEERPKAVAQQDLYDRLWPDTFVEKSNLHNLIYQLREAVEDAEQSIIRTVYGFGFALVAPATDVAQVLWQIVIAGREFDLHDGANLVGRELGAAVRIESGSISRHHARVTVTPGSVTLEDLGSKNGTTLRGSRIRSVSDVHDGDRIVFGTVSAVLRAVRASHTTETAAR